MNSIRSVVFVHGAGASPTSFTWLREQLMTDPAFFDEEINFYSISYSLDQTVSQVVDMANKIIDTLPNLTEGSVCVIGHSLGGIITAYLAENIFVGKIVTICAPFGGIKSATLLSWYHPLFRDVAPSGYTLTGLKHKPNTKPHLAIIGTSGLPLPREPNDGVVTVASQTATKTVLRKVVDLNHFEVLMSEDVADSIIEFVTLV